MSYRHSHRAIVAKLIAGITFVSVSILTGCGIGEPATAISEPAAGGTVLSGILHGGTNPIIGGTVTLYFTGSSGYGSGATAVASATTQSPSGTFTLPNPSSACPSNGYAYVGAYGGSTGAGTNNTTLLMVPIGACSSNYSASAPYSYIGTSTLWIDELTTAVSAYALGNFMTLSNSGMSGAPTCNGSVTCQINIGAPANNTVTASASTPSAAGLAHAFANALALLTVSTGQPTGYTNGGTSIATGGVVPDGEIYLVGNILQSCVNSPGLTGTNTAISNDGTNCGMLFSLVTPPQAGAAIPTNTLQAMLDLVKYPNPSLNTSVSPIVQNNWNSACTAVQTSGPNTATSCLFALSPSTGAAYPNALTSAPPDWTLAVVYKSGYGVQTSSCSSTCPGLTYPMYVALDYSDNVYTLNYNASAGTYPNNATTWTNIVGITNGGGSIFASAEDTTNTHINMIATDAAGHVFGPNTGSASGENVQVYNTSSGSVNTTLTYNNVAPLAVAADPFNNIYVASSTAGVNLREFLYTSGSWGSATNVTSTGPTYAVYQLAIDPNLDIYEMEDGTTPTAYAIYNKNASIATEGSYTAGTAPADAITITGNTNNAAGIAANSSNGAFVIDSVGVTPITKGGTTSSPTFTAGSPTAVATVDNSTLYNRYMVTDGNNWTYSPDGANGSAVSGVTVFDTVDSLGLGTYKGCYVVSSACGTTAGTAPMYSPRAIAIDSAGDIWIPSGASADVTELIGAAAPTWPGLSLAKFGLPH